MKITKAEKRMIDRMIETGEVPNKRITFTYEELRTVSSALRCYAYSIGYTTPVVRISSDTTLGAALNKIDDASAEVHQLFDKAQAQRKP